MQPPLSSRAKRRASEMRRGPPPVVDTTKEEEGPRRGGRGMTTSERRMLSGLEANTAKPASPSSYPSESKKTSEAGVKGGSGV